MTILLILDFVHVGVNYTDLPQTILNQRYPLPNGSRYHLVSSVSNFLHLKGYLLHPSQKLSALVWHSQYI